MVKSRVPSISQCNPLSISCSIRSKMKKIENIHMQNEVLSKSAGWTCHAVRCLQFKKYGKHLRCANDTSNKTCVCFIMESMDSNANNMGCLCTLRNWIKTGQCLDTGHSEGLVEKAKQAPSVSHTTHGVVCQNRSKKSRITRDEIIYKQTSKQTNIKQTWGGDGFKCQIKCGRILYTGYYIITLLHFILLLCKRKKKSSDPVRHQKSHCTGKTTGIET